MARLVHGNPVAIDYTPSGAVTAGDIVVLGDLIGMVPGDLSANQLGALYVGNCVIEIAKEAAVQHNAGDTVYWDASGKEVTKTASTHNVAGVVEITAAAADTTVRILLAPGPGAAE